MSARSPILIAYDGSTAARAAVQQAGALFAPGRAIVLTVWEPALADFTLVPDATGLGTTMMPYDSTVFREVDKAAADHARDIAEDGKKLAVAAGLDARPLVVEDESETAQTIVHEADTHDAAAIVIGSRGLKGLRSRLLGSTSKHVLERSTRPVVVVRHPEDAESEQ
ncbi:MAG TPA: universal stress protein [Solirubrobacteraceae bacterium]|jgi:nucleotide-binding universal stress UspA family protein